MAEGTRDWNPDSFFKVDDEEQTVAYTPDELASKFGLDESEYGTYFPKYDDWKTGFAEADYAIAQEEFTDSETLLKAKKLSGDEEIARKTEEVGTSLAQGLGSSYSQAATSYADATQQAIGQQVSFTSGASGRQKGEAFKRTQESLMENTVKQNTQFTSATGDLAKASTDLQNQYDFDTSQIARDKSSAKIDQDYKIKAAKAQWEESIYDTLASLTSAGAWDEEEEEKDFKGDYRGWDWWEKRKPGATPD